MLSSMPLKLPFEEQYASSVVFCHGAQLLKMIKAYPGGKLDECWTADLMRTLYNLALVSFLALSLS